MALLDKGVLQAQTQHLTHVHKFLHVELWRGVYQSCESLVHVFGRPKIHKRNLLDIWCNYLPEFINLCQPAIDLVAHGGDHIKHWYHVFFVY